MGISQDAEVLVEDAEVALLRVIYSRDFFHARASAYAIIAAYFTVMMFFDPLEYACSEVNPCLGCGFRTGIWLLLGGYVAEGFASNPLVAPAVAAALLAILDLLLGAVRWVTGMHDREAHR